jgi:hypothetical protein
MRALEDPVGRRKRLALLAAIMGSFVAGNLAYIKVGRRRLITQHHLQRFLEDASS